jgi:hypothetical protein
MLRALPKDMAFTKRRLFPDRIKGKDDFAKYVKLGALDCLVPLEPFLTRESKIVTMGSCFAQNIANHLAERGYGVHRFDVQERLFNPFALQAFLEGLAGNADFAQFEKHWKISPDQIEGTRAAIKNATTVIITFGLSLVWFDSASNEIIFDPAEKVGTALIFRNPDKYEMRQTEVADNFEAISAIVGAIKRMNPAAKSSSRCRRSPCAWRRAITR